MYGTSLGGIEQLMMLAPNFPQRRSGVVINNHFNCRGGIKICNGCVPVANVKSRGNPNYVFCYYTFRGVIYIFTISNDYSLEKQSISWEIL